MRGADLTGRRFGRLLVLSPAPPYAAPGGKHHPVFLCRCDCGGETRVRRDHLLCGDVVSCGCYKRELDRDRMRKINDKR